MVQKLTSFDERSRLDEEREDLFNGINSNTMHCPMLLKIRKRCAYCSSLGINSNCKYQCFKCKVYLHASGKDCFDKYHLELKATKVSSRESVCSTQESNYLMELIF